MSLELSQSATPVIANTSFDSRSVILSRDPGITLPMEDMLALAWYALTNTDLIAGDPRIEFVRRIKRLDVSAGFNPGGSRLAIQNHPRLGHVTESGRKFAVVCDANGISIEIDGSDRQIVIDSTPVSGADARVIHLDECDNEIASFEIPASKPPEASKKPDGKRPMRCDIDLDWCTYICPCGQELCTRRESDDAINRWLRDHREHTNLKILRHVTDDGNRIHSEPAPDTFSDYPTFDDTPEK